MTIGIKWLPPCTLDYIVPGGGCAPNWQNRKRPTITYPVYQFCFRFLCWNRLAEDCVPPHWTIEIDEYTFKVDPATAPHLYTTVHTSLLRRLKLQKRPPSPTRRMLHDVGPFRTPKSQNISKKEFVLTLLTLLGHFQKNDGQSKKVPVTYVPIYRKYTESEYRIQNNNL